MDYEKAYKEALERARAYNGYEVKNVCEIIFPELKESEDGRIRKDIVAAVETYGDFTQGRKEEIYTWLEKQSEQKLTYEVKPKFNVGDWVIVQGKTLYQIQQITELPYNHYQYWTTDEHWFGDATEARLWTIQDAKDGDVLNSYRVKATIIFKEWNSDGKHINAYCALQQGILIKQEMLWDRDFEPATKEQSDLFFQKISESGYKWESEKRELWKIEQNPARNEKDERIKSAILGFLEGSGQEMIVSGITLKDAIAWLEKQGEQKPAEWSEKDERMLKDIISGLEATKTLVYAHDKQGKAQMQERIDWIKSLKHQNGWRPSEEQMKWLKDVIETVPMTCRQQLPLESLYNDLKKL